MQPQSRAAELAEHAESVVQRQSTKGRRLLLLLVGLLVLGMGAAVVAAGVTLYEIHSCVTPGWACSNRNDEKTAVIVTHLNEGHDDIEADIADLKRAIRELRQ